MKISKDPGLFRCVAQPLERVAPFRSFSRWTKVAVVAGVLLAGGSMRAGPIIDFTWTGGGTPGNITDPANWTGGFVPAGTGASNENVTFSATVAQTIPIVPLTLHDLIFSGASRPAYNFGGSGTFTLTGNLTANAGGNIALGSSVSVALKSDGTDNAHTANLTDTTLIVDGNIGEIGSAASITKTGTGTLTLNGTNSYTGGTTLSAGTLVINSSSAIGTGRLTIAGGTIDYTRSASLVLTTNNPQTWSGSFTFAGSNNLNLGTGAVTLSGGSRTVTVTANTLTVGGVIDDGGSTFGLTKAGAGTLVLTGANGYDGTTTISGGTLQLGNGGTTGSLSSGAISIANGATFAVNRNAATSNTTLTLSNAISGAGNIVLNLAAALNPAVSPAAPFDDTVTLSGNNNGFSGSLTTTGNGTVALASSNARGTGDWAFSGNSTLDIAVDGSSGKNILRTTANTTFTDNAQLLAKNSYAISNGTQSFTGAAFLTASAANAITGDSSQTFFTGTNPLGTTSSFMAALTALDDATVGTVLKNTSRLIVDKASADPTIVGGTQTFNGYASLQANHAGAISDGSIQVFNGNSHLRASKGNAVEGGFQGFYDNSFLWAKTTDDGSAITGGHQMFYDFSTLVAATSNAVIGGMQTFTDNSTLLASAAGAIVGVDLTLKSNSLISVTANNALSDSTDIYFSGSDGGTGGTLRLNGHDTRVGEISSGFAGSGSGLIQNSNSTPATLVVIVGTEDTSTFTGTIQNGTLPSGAAGAALSFVKAGGGTLTLTGSNTFTGVTTISDGTLMLASAQALGGSTLDYAKGSANLAFASGLSAVSLGGLRGDKDISLQYHFSENNYPVALTVGANNQNTAYDGVLSGSGLGLGAGSSLTKTGIGFLYLTNANTYSGGTTINGGYLVLGNNGPTGSIAGNVAFTGNTALDGGELRLYHSNAVTFDGNISGPGRVSNFGNAVTLNGTNSYSGDTFLYSGSLTDNLAGAYSANSIMRVNAGATLNVTQPTTTIAGLDNYNLGVGGSVVLGSGVNLTTNDSFAHTFSGVISGVGGSLILNGVGSLDLAGANTYTGGTTLSNGALVLGSSSSGSLGSIISGPIGTGALTIATSSPTIAAGAPSVTLLNPINMPVGILTLGASPSNTALQSYTGNNLTLSAAITGGTPLVEVHGTGILTLGGANALGSVTAHDGGRIVASNNTALGGANSPVYLLDGSDLQFTTSAPTIGSLNGGVAAGTNLSFIDMTSATTLTINQTVDGTFSGTIAGTPPNFSGNTTPPFAGGSLVKNGSAVLTLAGANNYNGGTVINAGELKLASTGSLNTSGDVTVNNSAIFHVFANQTIRDLISSSNTGSVVIENGVTLTSNMPSPGTGSTSTFAGQMTGTGSFLKNGGGGSIMTLTGTIGLSGMTTISAGTLQIGDGGTLGGIAGNITVNSGGTLDFNRSDSNNYSAVLSGTGAIVKHGAGALALSGSANTFNGSVTINEGTLTFASTAANTGNNVAVTVVAPSTLFDVQNNLTIASLSGLGTAKIAGGKTLTFANSPTLATVISGTGNVSFLSTVNVKAVETYTGTTSLNGPMALNLGDGVTVGSVAGDISTINTSNVFFIEPIASPVSYAGIISGGGSLTLSSGNVTLSGASTYAGPTSINGGTLNIGIDSALPTGSVFVGTGATLNVLNNQAVSSLISTGSITVANTKVLTIANGAGGFLPIVSGLGGVTFNNPSNITANEPYTGPTTIKTGILGLGNGGTAGSVAGNLVINLTSPGPGDGVQFNRSDAVTYAGVVSGNGNLTKTGSGTLTLTGQSTYTANTTVNAGTLVIGTTNALPTTTGLGLNPGSTLDVAADQTITKFTSNASNALIKIESGKTLTAALGASVTTNGGIGSSFFGNITDGSVPGTGGIFRVGNDTDGRTIGLVGTNTYTGGTIIDPLGKLLLGNNTVMTSGVPFGTILGNVADDGLLIFNYGAITTFPGVISGSGGVALGTLSGTTTGDVRLTGANTYTGGTTVAAKALIIGDGGTTGSIVGNVVLQSNSNNNSAIGFAHSDNISFPGVISGTGSLVKAGTGALTLTGQNTFTGTTTVNSGTLIVGAQNTLPANTQLSLLSGALLDASNFNQTIAGFGPSSASSSILIGLTKTLTVAMPQANTFTSYPGTLTGGGTFAATGTDVVVNLTGDASGVITAPGPGVTLVVGSAPFTITSSLTFGGNTTNTLANPISGTGGVIATSGSLTLTGPSTYTGGTAVSGGKLIVNNSSGSGTGTGQVDVFSGALLGGSGIISGAVTLRAGSTIAPGNSPGTLTVGSATFAANATFAFDINDATGTPGTNWDLLNITGGLTITATNSLPFMISLTTLNGLSAGNAANFAATQSYQWKFLSASGGITGFTSPSVFSVSTTGFQNTIGPNAFFFVSQSGNDLFLNFSPVPEPSTWALLATGLGAFGFIAIRRRKKQ